MIDLINVEESLRNALEIIGWYCKHHDCKTCDLKINSDTCITDKDPDVWWMYLNADRKTEQTADDLIRKSDVLETYAELYDIFDDNKAIQEELHKVFDKINDIPTIEPNSSEKPNNCKTEPRKEQNFCGKCRYLYRDFKYGLSCYRLMDNEPCKYEERKESE